MAENTPTLTSYEEYMAPWNDDKREQEMETEEDDDRYEYDPDEDMDCFVEHYTNEE